MVAIIRTDVTAITNDHAWTRHNDVTTPTISDQPILEHPSELPSEFNTNKGISTENMARGPPKYGIRTPQFMPYEPFLWGVGVVFNLLLSRLLEASVALKETAMKCELPFYIVLRK